MTEIVKTEDGSDTLYVAELDEHYHSIHGAIMESGYIFIRSGFDFCRADPVRIFEAGFGTGLNVLLTAIRSIHENRKVIYTTIERYPLSEAIAGSLNYKDFVSDEGRIIFNRIHSLEWNTTVDLLERFSLRKIPGDLTTIRLDDNFDLIYFDAFSPDKQPEMWSEKVLQMIADHTVTGGILVTYSAKGEIKRKLRKAGFDVTLLPGPPGKRHIIRAVKI